MPWGEAAAPVRMQRVALVATAPRLREALVAVAEAGVAQLDAAGPGQGAGNHEASAETLLRGLPGDSRVLPRLSRVEPDLAALVDAGRADLLTGEAELERVASGTVGRGDLVALAGWVPYDALASLNERLVRCGSAAYPLDPPPGADPPTLLHPGGRVRSSFEPLVSTYATVPYVDLDPTLVIGVAYVLMFGMMFGDAGHGLLLVVAGLLLLLGRPRRAARLRRMWPFVVSAGCVATLFGLLYGEFFGPTGVVPVIWLSPLDEPVTLLVAALGLGAVLLTGAYVLGTINRSREGGWALALVSASGLAGAIVLAGAGVLLLGATTSHGWVVVAGASTAVVGLVLSYVGFLAAAGRGAAGVTQATVELVDSTLRLGANVVSFARLAAFGLMHAALGLVVWQATVNLWDRGGPLLLAAVAVFVVGQLLAFGLEALVAGVQALRLSYYELFSRVFVTEGRPFQPWQIPVDDVDATAMMEAGEVR